MRATVVKSHVQPGFTTVTRTRRTAQHRRGAAQTRRRSGASMRATVVKSHVQPDFTTVTRTHARHGARSAEPAGVLGSARGFSAILRRPKAGVDDLRGQGANSPAPQRRNNEADSHENTDRDPNGLKAHGEAPDITCLPEIRESLPQIGGNQSAHDGDAN